MDAVPGRPNLDRAAHAEARAPDADNGDKEPAVYSVCIAGLRRNDSAGLASGLDAELRNVFLCAIRAVAVRTTL
jgi:hypothetical protein